MKLNRGINLGGYLSQCDHETEHYQNFITEKDLEQIAAWGFDHVRLPIDYEVFEDNDGVEKKEGYEYVTRVVEWSSKYNMDIILDLHKAYGYDFNDAGNEVKNNLFTDEDLQKRFVSLWESITRKFSGYDHVALELLNEVVEEENVDLWNALIEKAVTAIRKISATVPIIYGGIQWNSAKTLKFLKTPKDKNIILTFHFYEPLLFTHQKAHWVPTMDKEKNVFYPDTMDYYKAISNTLGCQGQPVVQAEATTMGPEFIREMIQEAVDAATKHGARLYCGEFGVIDQAPAEDTLRWFTDVNQVFKEYNIGCAVWTYREKDFGLVGPHYESIRGRLMNTWMGR